MTDSASLAERIETVRFTPTRFGDGYEMGVIDTLLDALAMRARAGEPLVAALPSAQPPDARLREAYKAEEVRAFLLEVLQAAGEQPPPWITGTTAPWWEAAAVEQPPLPAAAGDVQDAGSTQPAEVAGSGDPASAAERIRAARFSPARMSAGYEMRAIDALLDDLARRAASGEALSPGLPRAEPPTSRLREAYRSDEVRTFLNELLAGQGERGLAWLAGESTHRTVTRVDDPDDDGGHNMPGREDPRGFFGRLFGG